VAVADYTLEVRSGARNWRDNSADLGCPTADRKPLAEAARSVRHDDWVESGTERSDAAWDLFGE
jgi:hypothetical protein